MKNLVLKKVLLILISLLFIACSSKKETKLHNVYQKVIITNINTGNIVMYDSVMSNIEINDNKKQCLFVISKNDGTMVKFDCSKFKIKMEDM